MKQYKVLKEHDRAFAGGFNSDSLERELNTYARDGWRVVTSSFILREGVTRDKAGDLIIILERDV